MLKKTFKSVVIVVITLFLTGCWDYANLDEITIVSAIAIDKNKENNMYHLTFEVVDIPRSSKEMGLNTTIIESDGYTIFDAIRNAKKRSENKLYFPAAEIIIISNQIAKEDGIASVVDMFFRDEELRETITYAISSEKTARELLMLDPVVGTLSAYEIRKIIKEDSFVTSSTNYMESAKLFNILKGEGKSLTMPKLIKTQNNDKLIAETDGMAVFKKDKLIGYINPYESKYHLFITNSVKGGIITLDLESKPKDNISLEIYSSSTTHSFNYKNNKITIKLKIDTEVFIAEASNLNIPLKEDLIRKLEKNASEKIKSEIKKLVKKAQTEFKTDIFSFGCIIHQSDPKLWEKLSKNWDKVFESIAVEVESEVMAINSAFIR